MNKTEAIQIIRFKLDPFREKPYLELVGMIDKDPVIGQTTSSSGKEYQFEIQAFWDGKPNGDIRVVGNIDNGGWRAFFPLGESVIKTSENQFVDE